MRFRQRHSQASMPTIDLIPMLNVLLGLLAFFVSVVMGLTVSRGVDVQLPDPDTPPTPVDEEVPPPLIVVVDAEEQFFIDDQPLSQSIVNAQIRAYLDASETGIVVLKAERQTPYQSVVQIVAEMQEIGGDRVSLSIDPSDINPSDID
ncbi:MAG: biopolymer transporter ExbD [Merismopedia sp. SIO2A8]|nr:biopolymer transporter ExbD [Symploca sp. SIO2B6]NET52647.1 biopolymer transporter ExbD [Merismopedia sp. SIO2A8]